MILLLFRGRNPFDRKRKVKVAPDVSANPDATVGQVSTAHVEDLKDLPPAEA